MSDVASARVICSLAQHNAFLHHKHIADDVSIVVPGKIMQLCRRFVNDLWPIMNSEVPVDGEARTEIREHGVPNWV